GQVAAVPVDDLAEQRDLARAVGDQAAHLVDELGDRAAGLAAAALRDDAVGAGPVAAVDDRDPAGRTARPGQRPGPLAPALAERGLERRVLQLGREVDPNRRRRGRGGARRLRAALDALEEAVELDRAEELVDVRRLAGQLGVVGADHAAADRDRNPGPTPLQLFQLAELAERLLLGRGAYRAGVQDDVVGLVEPAGRAQTAALQLPGELLRVGLVHLAADGPDVVAALGHGRDYRNRRYNPAALRRSARGVPVRTEVHRRARVDQGRRRPRARRHQRLRTG